jgi:hypothetical protein
MYVKFRKLGRRIISPVEPVSGLGKLQPQVHSKMRCENRSA